MIYVHGIERSLKDSLQFHLVHLILAIWELLFPRSKTVKSYSTQIKSIFYD